MVGFSGSFMAAANRTMDAFDVEGKFLVGCFFMLSKLKCRSSDSKQSSAVSHLWVFLSFSHTGRER